MWERRSALVQINEKYFYILCHCIRNNHRTYEACNSMHTCMVCDISTEIPTHVKVRNCQECYKIAEWHVKYKWTIIKLLNWKTILTRDVLNIIAKFTLPEFTR